MGKNSEINVDFNFSFDAEVKEKNEKEKKVPTVIDDDSPKPFLLDILFPDEKEKEKKEDEEKKKKKDTKKIVWKYKNNNNNRKFNNFRGRGRRGRVHNYQGRGSEILKSKDSEFRDVREEEWITPPKDYGLEKGVDNNSKNCNNIFQF